MKWKTTKYVPEEGHLRTVRKFAFLPKECGLFTVWLETYDSKQRYMKVAHFEDGGIVVPKFEWVEYQSEYLMLYP